MKWNNASDDWHTPKAENAPRPGGKFVYRMEAKDGSMGFDFGGIYDVVDNNKYIEYTLGDTRKVKIIFTDHIFLRCILLKFLAIHLIAGLGASLVGGLLYCRGRLQFSFYGRRVCSD